MTDSHLRVFLLEQEEAARLLVADRLNSTSNLVVIGATASHHDTAAALLGSRPNVVVFDHLPSNDDGHPFFGAARAIGAGLVLHCSIPPLPPPHDLRQMGVVAVVYKEVEKLEQLIAVISRFTGV
ncbi:MAG: hypothetical protein HKN03_11745 [Acidimicrobiales bacterium]|nr:hypothetical protein [Acidimicrobiales bacterium]